MLSLNRKRKTADWKSLYSFPAERRSASTFALWIYIVGCYRCRHWMAELTPTSWTETTRLLFCRICTSCWAKRKIRLHKISEPKVSYCSVGYAIRQHKISGFVIRKTFRFVFYTSICIMLSLNRKRKIADWKSWYSFPAERRSAGTFAL